MKTKLLLSLALWILSTAFSVAALSVTFTNPAPAYADAFGSAVAALGSDKVLIGAYLDDNGATDAGGTYIFGTNGSLLVVNPNPSPGDSERFGSAVAAVGNNHLLVGVPGDNRGAPGAGAAYLFSVSGTLLTTFANPTPAKADKFGYAVAAIGSDKILIGAYDDDAGAPNAGVAYLFSTNGTLLTTFANPTPGSGEAFGCALTAVGTDKVLIGANGNDTGATDAGAAYLFSTNGTLLITFTNPTPAYLDQFGSSVAAVGTDKVVIGAPLDDQGANGDVGAVYLFGTDGTLLLTFTNAGALTGWFGYALAATGDRVLVGAPRDDTGAPDAGAAYLFGTNGLLLATYADPSPGDTDLFGSAVAIVNANTVPIGAPLDDAGSTNAGVAYIFSDPLPLALTLSASSGPDNSVMLHGTANPNGPTTLARFDWGTTTNYGNNTASTNVGNGSSPVSVSLLATNLVADTLYHYRIVASNVFGTVTGSDGTFPFPFPMVLTDPPTDVTARSATLQGTVYPDGWPVTAWFRWRDANGNGSDETNSIPLHISQRTNGVPLSQPVTGLVPGRTYTFDLWVSQGSFTAYQTGAFTTPLPAIPITFSGSSITPSNATLTGSANPRSLPTRTWFEWGTTTNYGNITPSMDLGSGSASVPVNMGISQLSGLSDYHFRLVVSNAAGVFYGEDNELSTPPGRQVADGFYVTPTLIPANTAPGHPTRVTATACGNRRFPTTGDWRIRLTLGGQPLVTNIAIVSATATKAVFNFPSKATGFYGFLVQYSNEVTHVWEDIYESGPRFFQVGEDAVAHTYNPFPRGNWTVPTQPKNFIGTVPGIVAGVITGAVTVAQQVHPADPLSLWPPWEHMSECANSGYLYLGWTKDFPGDAEGNAGVSLDFNFPMDGTVTFDYAIPFQMILDFPTNVYAGQKIQLKARDFRFNGGTLTAQHNLAFSTYHSLWLNAPYDLGFPPVDNEHSFKPDRLVVWGELPVAPGLAVKYGPLDSREFPWDQLPYADLFDDGKVTIAEIAGLPDFTGLPDYLQSRVSYANITLGGQMSFTTSGNTNRFWYGPHEIWTAGPHEGWQDTPQLWYANADMIGLTYVSGIPYYSQAAAPLFFAGVELGLNCGVNVRSRDVISLKPPYTHDITVTIPAGAIGSYTVVTNLSLPVDATFVSYYLYKLWGGLYFDMPFVDRKDLGWSDDDFWRPEVSTNISVTATFAVNKAVWVTNKSTWAGNFLQAAYQPEWDYDLISYPPAEADEERRCIANLSFNGPPPPPMVPQVILGTFSVKPTSKMELMLAANPVAGVTSITLAPSPVAGGYSNGTVVTVTAQAARGYRFTGWSGDITGAANPATITMNTNKSVMANFTTATLTGAGYSTNGTFSFYVGGFTGLTWVVQWSTNLTSWLPLRTNTSPFTFTDTNAGQYPQCFYRALLLP